MLGYIFDVDMTYIDYIYICQLVNNYIAYLHDPSISRLTPRATAMLPVSEAIIYIYFRFSIGGEN